MILFKYIKWRNFLSTGNAFTEIKLDKTENTLIIGENGAGKSTILDALCYCLFGKPFRGINLPTLINSINGSDLVTECMFTIGTHEYKVIRGMKPAIFEIYKDNILVDQPSKIDYQEYLETFILRWNRKTFTQVAVLGNANFVPFMQLKAADRRSIIDDILDVQIFSTMSKLLGERLKLLKEDLNKNKHTEELVRKESDIKRVHIDQLQRDKQKQIDEIEAKILEIDKFVNESSNAIENNKIAIGEYERAIQKKQDILDKQKKTDTYYVGISQNLDKSNTNIQFWLNSTTCPTCEEPISKHKAEEKLKYCTQKKSEYAEALNALRIMLNQQADKLRDIASYEKTISEKNQINSKKIIEMGAQLQNKSEYQKKKIELSKDQDKLSGEAGELADLEEKLVDLNDAREELLHNQAHYDVAAQLLKDNGIKAKIIKQYLPIINKLVNKYLAEQDFFVNFELDESFKEIIRSRYRDEFSYENFSEGEKQKIDMSLMLTWREVAKLKNSAATNILILDEIFDSSLDSQGVEYLMKLLHGLEKCNLFVISHKGDILQDKFKSIVKFEKQGNYSRIV